MSNASQQTKPPVQQGGTLPLQRVKLALTLPDILELPLLGFSADWFGSPPAAETGFVLAASDECLYFGARCRQHPSCLPNLSEHEFTEGLWERDLGELFIREPGSLRYQEWNLAPTGAKWSMFFSKVRERDPVNFKYPAGVTTFSRIGKDRWEAVLAVPFSALSFPLQAGQIFSANVTFIINTAGKKQYLSWAKIKSANPDYHQPADFVSCQENNHE